MRQVWFIARKDVAYLLREKVALVWLFLMPPVFFYFIGTVTGGMAGGAGGPRDRLAVASPRDAGYLGEQLLRRLGENHFDTVVYRPGEQGSGDAALAFADQPRRLTVPADFSRRVQDGTAPPLRFETGGTALTRSYDEFRVQRAVYTLLADVLTLQGESASAWAEGLDRLNAAPRRLQLRERPAGKLLEIPSGFEQAVPGMMVMFTMIVLFTSGAATLFNERRAGMLRRLAAAPLNPLQIVLGKLCGRLALALIQVLFAMLAGSLLFGVDWGPDLPMVLAVLFAWALFCAALATLLGSTARSEAQVVSLGLSTALIMGALGGCMWPVEISPAWMQFLQKGLPAGWAMDALHQLVNFRNGAAAGAWQLAMLLAAASAVTLLAARRFRYTV